MPFMTCRCSSFPDGKETEGRIVVPPDWQIRQQRRRPTKRQQEFKEKQIMKKMHKFITAVAVIGLSGSIAFAATQGEGEGKGWHHGHGHSEAKLAQKLNLTDAQKTQWKAERKAFYEANKTTFEQFRALH